MLLLQLLSLALLLILLVGLLSPFESLGWWAGWFGTPKEGVSEEPVGKVEERAGAEQYLVYLSGIGAVSGDFLEKEERAFLENVAERLPELVVIGDIFPYAMDNNGLTGQRVFSALWRWIVKLKLENKVLAVILIVLRNLFQVMVCADPRYGPVYNFGTAQGLFEGLQRHGYQVGSGKMVTILGYSGGVQVALGAASYLQPALGAPLCIISFGGVMADDPGLMYIEHLYHFHGSKDVIEPMGRIAYAGRWPFLSYSAWNKAKAQGKITFIPGGPVAHNDPGGYFLAKIGQNGEKIVTPEDSIHEQVITILQHQLKE